MTTVNKAIQELGDKLKAGGYAYHIGDDNLIIVPRVKALKDHGLEHDQFLITSLMELNGGWSGIIQTKIRKVDETDPLFNLENNKKILEPIRQLMEDTYPCLDVQGNIKINWEIEYDFENIIGEEKTRVAAVEGVFGMRTSVEDMYQLLLRLPEIKEVVLEFETV